MKFTRILTGTILLFCPAGMVFGQNATPQNKVQSGQTQTAKPVVATKPAVATKSAVKSVQFKTEAAKPATIKVAQVKATAPKPATTKPVAVKAATTKPVKPATMHAAPAAVKTPVHISTAAKTNNSVVKVATYPAAKTKSASPKHVVSDKHTVSDKKVASAKKDPFRKEKKAAIEVTKTKTAAPEKTADKTNDKTAEKTEDKVVLTGRRDPFVSPVMEQSASNNGCTTGKRCLAIDQISLKGIVKSENGMIAVVENALDKAYFLHENDPVFDGYVVKITGDSIIFRETLQDKLGKAFTRDVTKRISTPAV